MDHSRQLLSAFQAAAADVPAYARILAEAGVDPREVRSADDFRARVPVLTKADTFGRFGIKELCRGGELPDVRGVLTSSGHSGRFSFGIYTPARAEREAEEIDSALDRLFGVRAKRTLLINALPMGVGVPSRACTIGQTSVRADMVVGQVEQFGPHFEQIILVGDAVFLKHALELGQAQGLNWRDLLVHCVVGEEPLAENARDYLAGLLGCGGDEAETGLIASSMGVAELGLNLFFETVELIRLRRRLRHDARLRTELLGEAIGPLPMLFAYDPARIYAEVLPDGRLALSTLEASAEVPLLRYATGDAARLLEPTRLAAAAGGEAANLPVACIYGRAKGLQTPGGVVYPEQVKEGLYARSELAAKTTGNFRLSQQDGRLRVRIQLVPGQSPAPALPGAFADALAAHLRAPFDVDVEAYETFGSGMRLDYERKFDYLGP